MAEWLTARTQAVLAGIKRFDSYMMAENWTDRSTYQAAVCGYAPKTMIRKVRGSFFVTRARFCDCRIKVGGYIR